MRAFPTFQQSLNYFAGGNITEIVLHTCGSWAELSNIRHNVDLEFYKKQDLCDNFACCQNHENFYYYNWPKPHSKV